MKEMVFDILNPNWTEDSVYVEHWFQHMEQYLNALLNQKGYVYLSEIYENLGFDWDPKDENIVFAKGQVDGIRLVRIEKWGMEEDGKYHVKYLINPVTYKIEMSL